MLYPRVQPGQQVAKGYNNVKDCGWYNLRGASVSAKTFIRAPHTSTIALDEVLNTHLCTSSRVAFTMQIQNLGAILKFLAFGAHHNYM